LRGNGKLESVVFEKNRLEGPAGKQRPAGTGDRYEIPCGLLFRSVGYRGVPVEGVPFDERRGVFPNVEGRITVNDEVVPARYAAGWIKRGPSGIIGTNKPCSFETAARLLDDMPALAPCAEPDRGALRAFLETKGLRAISYDDWKRIDAAEVARGKPLGKPREKFVTVAEMLGAAG